MGACVSFLPPFPFIPRTNSKPCKPAVEGTAFPRCEESGGGGDFLGGPVVKTSSSNAGGEGLIPGQGARVPHASWPKKPKHKTEAIL